MARGITFLLAGLFLAVLAVVTHAAPKPVLKTIEYRIHQTPADATSPVVLRVRFTLSKEKERTSKLGGQLVGWRVLTMRVQQSEGVSSGIISKRPRIEKVWSLKNPTLKSPDGLWWIAHADPAKPVLSEFDVLPEIAGTAKPVRGVPATTQNNDDLVIQIKGSKYTPPSPPEEPPYSPTFACTYKFELQQTPGNLTIKEGTDDPVEPVPVNPGDPDVPPDELRIRSH